MQNLKFHPDVATEIRSSYSWYQKQVDGLGDDFLDELESAYQVIIEFPQTWPFFQNEFRRYLLPRFPFSVLYREHNNSIYSCSYAQQQETWLLVSSDIIAPFPLLIFRSYAEGCQE